MQEAANKKNSAALESLGTIPLPVVDKPSMGEPVELQEVDVVEVEPEPVLVVEPPRAPKRKSPPTMGTTSACNTKPRAGGGKDKDFELPSAPDGLQILAYLANVHKMRNIDLHATTFPESIPGRDIIKRIAHTVQCEKMAAEKPEHILDVIGLQVSQLAAHILELRDMVVHTRDQLFKATKALDAKDAELKKLSSEHKSNKSDLVAAYNKIDKLERSAADQKVLIAELRIKMMAQEADRAMAVEQAKTAEEKIKENKEKLWAEFAVQAEQVRTQAVADWKSSDDFILFQVTEIYPFYEQGRNHVLRMASASGTSHRKLLDWAMASHYGEVARSQHHVVPYSEDELTCLKDGDLKAGVTEEWVPPQTIEHTILGLLDHVNSGGEATWDASAKSWTLNDPPASPEEPATTEPPATQEDAVDAAYSLLMLACL